MGHNGSLSLLQWVRCGNLLCSVFSHMCPSLPDKHIFRTNSSQDAGKARGVLLMCYLYKAPPFTRPPRSDLNAEISDAVAAATAAGVEWWQVVPRSTKIFFSALVVLDKVYLYVGPVDCVR